MGMCDVVGDHSEVLPHVATPALEVACFPIGDGDLHPVLQPQIDTIGWACPCLKGSLNLPCSSLHSTSPFPYSFLLLLLISSYMINRHIQSMGTFGFARDNCIEWQFVSMWSVPERSGYHCCCCLCKLLPCSCNSAVCCSTPRLRTTTPCSTYKNGVFWVCWAMWMPNSDWLSVFV